MADGKAQTILLNETNYNTWKVQCRMVLMREGLWRIVNGTEVEPEDNGIVGQGGNAAAVNKYIARKEKALATIVLSIEPSLLYLVGDPQEPSVLWEQLSEQFQKKSWANKLSLRRKLMDLTLNDNEPVKDHIKAMTEIFQELSVVGDHIDDEARVVHLLASLRNHTSFSMLVTALESSPEVPQIELVTERLLHEERKLKEKAAQAHNDAANRALVGRQQGGGRRNQRNSQRSNSNNNSGSTSQAAGNNSHNQGPKCYECGLFGHKRTSCPEFIRKMVEKQVANMAISNGDDDCETGFVVREVCQAYSMRSMKERIEEWVLDSGCTQHMCYDKSLFHNGLSKLKNPKGVELGDGYIVTAEYQGDVILDVEVEPGIFKKCKLKDVLYVPDLSCNLVSISRATKAGQQVIFESDKCTIFDKARNKPSATGKSIGDLWYLNLFKNEVERVNAAISKETTKGEENKKVDINIAISEVKSSENQFMESNKELSTNNTDSTEIQDNEEPIRETNMKTSVMGESKQPSSENVEESQKKDGEVSEEAEKKVEEVKEESKTRSMPGKMPSSLWHSRYGHLGVQNMRKLCQRHLVKGFNYDLSSNQEFCEPCVKGKHHHQKFPTEGGKRAKDKLELVHTDVCGKLESKSLGGCEYFLSFIDDMSRYTWCYPLKKKSDVYQKFLEWKTMVERSSERPLKKIRSDNGGEYTSKEFAEHLREEGITRQLTIPKTPQQNGVAERLNRTLEEMIRSMLAESQAPKRFWAEALSTATYLRNRSPTSALNEMTPHEAWTGDKPNVEHLRVFGCTAYAHIPKDERQKLDPKARKCIMLGYGTEVKGYRLFNPETQRILYSRDVIFNETEFYFKDKSMKNKVEENERSPATHFEVVIDTSEDEHENDEENFETNTEVEDNSRPVRNRNAPD